LLQVDAVLRGNWLKRRALFDFDLVEVVSAADSEVERFCIQVASETDPARRSRYKCAPCVIHPGSGLSERAQRMFASCLGSVCLTSTIIPH